LDGSHALGDAVFSGNSKSGFQIEPGQKITESELLFYLVTRLFAQWL
jgi:hypothetical protein